uniref:type IV secretory system conjugative DNA transfer family protein n=1 Tax=Succinivibrio sp. TaxID=2053619 RepID=UPI0038640558
MGQPKKKFKLNMMYVVPVLVIIGFIALCYVGSLLLMHLNGLPLDKAGPFTAFRYFPIYKNSPVKSVRLTVIFCAAFPFLVSAGIAVLFYITKYKPRALHGDARFATYMEIKKAGLVARESYDKTILVGQYKEHGRNEYLCYGGYQFVMLAAPTRSGKGVGVVIPNCLNYSDSLVVLDIKLENFDKTSGFRAKSGQEVYLFAPYDECESERQEGKPAPMRTHRYNPLGYVSEDPVDRIGDIDSIAQAFYNNPNSKDKFFDEQAKDLFRGITLLVLETPGIPHTLGEVFRQSSGYGKALPEHLNEMIEKAKAEGRPYSDECVAAISRVCTLSDNTFAGVKGSMQVPLMPWANARVDAATSANDFDLRDVRKKRMTIYVGITPNKLAEAKNIINLFFDQLINLNTKTLPQQDKSLKYQCLMILDEFTAAGKINQIAQSISYQAGYNMRVLTIIQNKSQLEDVYGKPGALTLMSNHALMIMYAPSPVVQSD